MVDISPHHVERITEAHQRLDEHDRRINQLERDGDVAAERFRVIQRSLDGIQTSLNKGVWIVLTGVLGGIVAFLIRGGLTLGQ